MFSPATPMRREAPAERRAQDRMISIGRMKKKIVRRSRRRRRFVERWRGFPIHHPFQAQQGDSW
jgi:hypothetical protein